MEGKTRFGSSLAFNLKRFLGFTKLFLRNKRALLGVFIIMFYVFVAIFAPFIASFDPIGVDPTVKGYVAGKYAAPEWLRSIPESIGGNPSLSGNLEVLKDAGFPELRPNGEINYTIPEGLSDYVNVETADDVGFPYPIVGIKIEKKDGSLRVNFQRETDVPLNESKVYIYKDFYYPYSGPPSMYIGNAEFLINGTYSLQINPEEQWYIVYLKNTSPTQEKSGNLTLSVSTSLGLYIAVSDDLTTYFAEHQKWKDEGYKSWKEWLNGTDELRHHWDEMRWIVSEGSLTNKTYEEIWNSTTPSMYNDSGDVPYYSFMNDSKICDPDLDNPNNDPDIYAVRNWIKIFSTLSVACFPGNTTLNVTSTVGFKKGDSIIIGSGEFAESNIIKSIKPNFLELESPILWAHDQGEVVALTEQEVMLYENYVLAPKEERWMLIKLVLKDLEQTYTIKPLYYLSDGSIRTDIASVFSEEYNYPETGWTKTRISKWNVFRTLKTLDVPVKIRMFLGKKIFSFENLTTIFPIWGHVPSGFSLDYNKKEVFIDKALSGSKTNDYWIIPKNSRMSPMSLIQSEVPSDIKDLFKDMPGEYRFGIELTFIDVTSPGKNVSSEVYIDDLQLKLLGTSFSLLGTDQYGRDLFSQLVYGTRISLYIGILVSIISVAVGLIVGLAAGYLGGAIDQFLMRFNDLMLVLPGLPLMIVLVAVLGAKIENLILLLGFLGWNGFARLVRSQVLSLRERTFVEAARASGAGSGHIIMKHLLPNVMSLAYISLATSVPGAITAEAALSWLGFFDPSRMSWGRMLHEVFVSGATTNWWWIIPPGICIASIAVAFILLGYALDEVLNPKLRMRR